MPRIKDYPKYEDHVDKTMTWDKKNKMLLPPGRTKLLQDGRFIFDMDDGTYTVSMQYFIENVLGLVNKDDKTIVSDIKIVGYDSSNPAALKLDRLRLEIYTENIDNDGDKVWHRGYQSLDFMRVFDAIIRQNKIISCGNAKTTNTDGFIECLIPDEDNAYNHLSIKIPLKAITNISVTDGKLTYKVGDDTKTLDLTSVINNTVSNSGELQQKVSDLVDFRMSPMTPLINSAITSIDVSDAGNMHWLSYDGNTTDGSFDFGAFVDKKLASSKPADLPTDLTRKLDISSSGTATWTVNGEQKSVDIASAVTRQVNAKFAMRVDSLSQRVGKAVTNFDINNAGVTTWTSDGDSHTFDIGSMVDGKVDEKLKSMPKPSNNGLQSLQINGDSGQFVWLESGGAPHFFELKDFLSRNVPSIVENKANKDWVTNQISQAVSTYSSKDWVKDQINQAITTYSSGAATGQRLAKFAKELNVDSSGTMTWTSSDGQSHSVNLRQFGSSSSVSAIPESYITNVL